MSVSLIINIIIFMNAKPYRFSTTDQNESKRHPLPSPKQPPPQKKNKKLKKTKKPKKNTGPASKYVNV